MLEKNFDVRGQFAERSKSPQPVRRSARLARNQKRTGRWRNDQKQRKEAAEAVKRSEQAASSGTRGPRGEGRDNSTAEPAGGLGSVEHEKNKTD